MDPERWQRVQVLFEGALDRAEPERLAFLMAAAGADQTIVSEVQALLTEDARHSILDQSVGQVAGRILPSGGADAALPVEQFGPYNLMRLLGEGGMGIVYLAERQDLGSLAAIKILRDAWMSPARRQRFAVEQRTLAQLTHRSIARLYDADTLADGTPWFAMEYVEGVPLTEYCTQQHSSIDQRLKLLLSVCEAVQYAHSRAVIHRDLKPSNILVQADGTPKLLDFGIAKHLEQADTVAAQTITGLRMLTPAYAAPEQIRGEHAGIQGDVYSLGVILYELLTGRLPFELSHCTPTQAEKLLSEQEPPRPSAVSSIASAPLGKSAWADLDVVCLKAMHRDLQQRYQSAEALIRDLTHYLKGEPLEARPDTLRYRAGKFISRNARAVAATAVAVALVIALVVFFTVRLAIERDNANRQTAIATAVNQFLSDDLLGRSNPFQSGKATETFLEAVKLASPAIDRKFKNEPEVGAHLHLTIAQALDNRTNYTEARQQYEQARQLFLRTEGPLSQNAVTLQLQRAAMEARTYQSGSVPLAKSLVAEQEAILQRIKQPRKDLLVWLNAAKGMIALIENDAKSANRFFKLASDTATILPGFDQTARSNFRQRLAFTYIRLGDGVTAERLDRELIASYGRETSPANPYILRLRLNLAQALMIQAKYQESVQEANNIYSDFIATFGADHELTMQLLATRAQSEGSLGLFEDSQRDDLAVYKIALQKQGPTSFFAIGTLSDAAVAQCRTNHLTEGYGNARNAYESSVKAFGLRAGLSQGSALTVANCLIALGRDSEAARLVGQIDAKVVAQLTGDPNWGANVELAQAEIALHQGDVALAQQYIESARPGFSQPGAEAYQKRKLEALEADIKRRR